MNKYTSYTVILLLLLAIGYTIFNLLDNEDPATEKPRLTIGSDFVLNDLEEITAPDTAPFDEKLSQSSTTEEIAPTETVTTALAEVVAENLTIPWDIAFLPNGNLLIVERGGALIEFDTSTSTHTSIDIEGVLHVGEGGLLGMVLHPNFEENGHLYLYRTSSLAGKSVNTILRYVYKNNVLEEETIILGNIPGALFHNGGRMAFGPDGYLYVTTGDAQNPELSQDTKSLAGKILRITEDGGIPGDNPFDNEVYAYGLRNPQGITWDEDGALWSTDHGRSGVRSGLDELNLIIKGENYGWPESQGDISVPGTVGPIIHSGPDVTWAPASAAYFDGSVFFGGLKGETLYEAIISGVGVSELEAHFTGEYGRIRTTVLGPDGYLYFMTSNRDGRAKLISEGDDKVLRVNLESI